MRRMKTANTKMSNQRKMLKPGVCLDQGVEAAGEGVVDGAEAAAEARAEVVGEGEGVDASAFRQKKDLQPKSHLSVNRRGQSPSPGQKRRGGSTVLHAAGRGGARGAAEAGSSFDGLTYKKYVGARTSHKQRRSQRQAVNM